MPAASARRRESPASPGKRGAPARYATRRTARRSYGPQVAEVALALGLPLMPWQRRVLTTALEHDSEGHHVYRTVVVTVPRQNGKTSLLWALMAWWALAHDHNGIVATAQTGIEAYEKWREFAALVEGNEHLGEHVRDVRRSNGSESITYDTGSVHRVRAPTARAGHGLTLDLAIIDEAWSLTDEVVVQSFRPAMVTRRDAQLWVVSTAGTSASVLLRRHVEMGRASVESGEAKGLAYFEWSAPDELPSDDPRALRAAMPALGHTITEEIALADRATMTPGEYERAYLNRWTDALETVIPLNLWRLVNDEEASPDGAVWLAFDVTPERDAASIVAAGWMGGRVAVELVDHRPGVEWVIPRLAELLARHDVTGVVVDGTGPAGALVEDLNESPVVLTYKAMQTACALFFDAVTIGSVVVRPNDALDAAVRSAARVGGGDLWRWGRKRSAGDIGPLVGATIAYLQARQSRGGALRVW